MVYRNGAVIRGATPPFISRDTQVGKLQKLNGFRNLGRRPKPKSEEFFEFTIWGAEIFAILCLKPLKKCYTVWEHHPCSALSSLSGLSSEETLTLTRDGPCDGLRVNNIEMQIRLGQDMQ